MEWSKVSGEEVEFTTPLPESSILSHLSSKNAPILDIGCGYGRTLTHLQNQDSTKLTGVDASPEVLKRATDQGVTAVLLQGDMEKIDKLKELDQKYELILLIGVIEYFLDDEAQEKVMKTISKKLAPNGKVFLETFTFDWKNNWKEYLLGLL